MTDTPPGFTRDVHAGKVVFVRTENAAEALLYAVLRAFKDDPPRFREFRDTILPRLTPLETALAYLVLQARDADQPVVAWQYVPYLQAMGFPKATEASVGQRLFHLKRKLGSWWNWFTQAKGGDPVTVVREVELGPDRTAYEVSPRRVERLERQLDTPDMEGHDPPS